jgi:hypothetical protein
MTIDILKMDPKTELSGDFLAKGTNFDPVPTGVYPYIIELAYLGESSGGAVELNLHCKPADDTGCYLRTKLYVTTGKAKGRKSTMTGEDGVVRPLPSRERMEELARLCANKSADQLNTENKIIKLWDWNTRSEEPVEKPILPELMNKPVLLGLLKVETNQWRNGKRLKDRKFKNEIEKVFSPKGFTYTELENGADEPEFIHDWKESFHSERVKDDYTPVKETTPTMAVSDDDVPWPDTTDSDDTADSNKAETVSLFG